MADYVIRGGTVVDGTGGPSRVADVAIEDGKIVAIGEIADSGALELDAQGLMVAPGIIDPHTHYDAQLFWDPSASPSNLHGVTSIIGGNCGFSLAPINAIDADYIRRMMAKVEGMPLEALENGVPWSWSTFGEYLDALDGKLGVNAGFLVGHCALRRKVMGAARDQEVATDEEIEQMVSLLGESIQAGGLGFSSSQSRTHSDGENKPVNSRIADRREMLAFCTEVGQHEGTTLEYITNGCLDNFSDEEIDLMTEMSVAANRPLNWNVLSVDARSEKKVQRQLEAGTVAAERGGKIIALTMPTLVPMNMSFGSHCALFLIPGWGETMQLPVPERIAALSDPAVRLKLNELANSKDAGIFRHLATWGRFTIGDTFSPVNEGLAGRSVESIATERGQDPFDALLDLVIADGLRTVLWPPSMGVTAEDWAARAAAWADDRIMLGGSDAGAHLDRMCGSNYPTAFLADVLRGHQLVSVERAIAMMTSDPAKLFGLKGRGVIAEGNHADLFIFDPKTIGSEAAKLVEDLPGGSARLTAGSTGVVRVIVGGVDTVCDGVATGATPGSILRSGQATVSVTTH